MIRRMTFCALFLGMLAMTPSMTARELISFNRQIRPILSDKCYACHGPDEKKRKAGLRLDMKESALGKLKSGQRAVVPGKVQESSLVARITSHDPDEVMPPAEGGKALNPSEIELLNGWIASGAMWNEHWSYVAPERPALPSVKDPKWARNEIDRFTLSKLEAEGLNPAPEAGKSTLLRRATLDLTGLPPTIDEIDAFLADSSADAYEKVVDGLLAAAQYGERMAVNWLDLARYADTSGYHFDGQRQMWTWRNWVIEAFNRNMPFDQFTIEQLAGDMLPNATVQQRVASGFHRNVMTNDEGGADPDEYLSKYVVDRVATTGVVWLGSTIGCAECHDHKYDPFSQKEFYQLYAFFHNVPEKGIDGTRTENPLPRLAVPTQEQAVELIELDRVVQEAEANLARREGELPGVQNKWETEVLRKGSVSPARAGLLTHFAFQEDASFADSTGARTSAKASGASWTAGKIGQGLNLNGRDQFVEAGSTIAFERTNAFSFGAWIFYRHNQGAIVSRMNDEENYRGYDLLLMDGAFEVHLASKWPDDGLKVRTKKSFPKERWLHVFATYDGSSKAAGVKVFINGQEQALETKTDKLAGTILTETPLHIGKRSKSFYFNGLIDEARIYDRTLSKDEIVTIALEGYWPILAIPSERRTAIEADSLRAFFRDSFALDFQVAEANLSQARGRKAEFLKRIPNTMVMQEMEKPRDTFILTRGNFQQKGEKVSPGIPSILPPLPAGEPANRLALARWLVSKEHPLTSRVTVNRWWAIFFGAGLVATMNDFGSQGEWPSHPELLEWLACQFRDGGGANHARPWDVKAMVKMIVTSATYRQVAVATPRLLERDPYNRLFTRGPRLRLDAEFIRDNALAIGGLLNGKIGGESVRPYQPAGLWDVTDSKYEQSHGADLYRRGLYVYWKRAVHYPSLATFDAPNRETCTAFRPRTSTPLQSFVLMNDPVYVEAARGFALRMLREARNDPEERLLFGFRTALSRRPSARELSLLQQTLRDAEKTYEADESAASDLIGIGESKNPEDISVKELAAYTCVANVLLNLNETISR